MSASCYDLRVSTIRKRQESITRSAAVLVITHPLIALANHGGPRVRIATQTGLRTPTDQWVALNKRTERVCLLQPPDRGGIYRIAPGDVGLRLASP
jgi:hypothetical protein